MRAGEAEAVVATLEVEAGDTSAAEVSLAEAEWVAAASGVAPGLAEADLAQPAGSAVVSAVALSAGR